MLVWLLAKTKKFQPRMNANEHESRQDKPCGVCAGANSSGAALLTPQGKPSAGVFQFVFIRVHSWLVAYNIQDATPNLQRHGPRRNQSRVRCWMLNVECFAPPMHRLT